MFVVGLASARSTSPRPAQQPTTAVAPPRPSAAVSARPQPSAVATAPQPSAQVTVPSSPPTAAPAPAGSLQLNNVQTLGDGGTGWQVQTLRYGAHAGFLRTVFDLTSTTAPASTPKITVGFTDPTTMIVAFQGASPGGPVSAPPGSVVAGVVQMQPSPMAGATVYQFKLTHAVTIKPALVVSPLRLVIDLPT
jgi:hypothetical protein